MKTPIRLQPRFGRGSLFHQLLALLLIVQMVIPAKLFAADPVSTTAVVRSGYDGNGNVVTRTDANGAVTNYAFDSVNRLTSIDYPGGITADVSFVFDSNGNTTSMTDATGTTTFQYDTRDRLMQVDYPDAGFVIYGYDKAGNITTRVYGNRKGQAYGEDYTHMQYTYDANNRLATVKNVKANAVTSYTYDDSGHPLKRTLPNGVTTDYTCDGDGRLVSVDHKKTDGSRVCKYTYTLNAIGNRIQVVETLPDGSTKTTGYTYDALDRLSTATYPNGRTVGYLYDTMGNRTKMTETTSGSPKVTDYVYDSDSRLLSTKVNNVADETFSYDVKGNLIQRVRAGDNRQIDYFYDAESRLVRYYDGTSNIQYIYNGSGVRVARIVNGLRTNFVNDLNRTHVQVLSETDVTGNAQRVYVWGNELIDQQLGSGRGYYLLDSTDGSVRRLLDSSGSVINLYEYDAFGFPTTKTEGVPNDYQFRAECQEQFGSLLFLRNRYYNTESGRFTSRDIAWADKRNAQTANPYLFALNDPVNKTDPSGLFPGEETMNDLIDFLADLATFHPGLFDKNYPQNFCGRAPERTARTVFGEGNLAGARAWVQDQPISNFQKQQQDACVCHDYEVTEAFWNLSANADADMNLAVRSPSPIMTGLFGTMSVLGRVQSGLESIGNFAGRAFNAIGNLFSSFLGFLGGVSLDKSATVMLDINDIKGAAYDPASGQIVLYGKKDASSTALPKMSLDDLAVVVRAKQLGSFPVVSIEEPKVTNPPGWPGRECFTVRYGPFYQDSVDGQTKVLDLSSNTHVGWVMAEADRHMKALGLGKDNRTLTPVSSNVPGYKNMVTLALQYVRGGDVTNRLWFNPKEIVVQPSADGKSMEITKADMQVSTEAAFASNGQVEGTPDAQYFAAWFTSNYDAIAEEQVVMDAAGQPHKIYKELKQLAYLAGVVKWISDNNIPLDLSFLKDYQPTPYPEAPRVTPITTVSGTRNFGGGVSITVSITGGVDFCNDLSIGTGGNPSASASAALTERPNENTLGWSYGYAGNTYNATAVSLDRTEKAGNFSPSASDAIFKVNGSMPLTLSRYFDSFNVNRTMFGYGWSAQPYALAFKGSREVFSLCHQTWSGYGEVWFLDRGAGRGYKFVPAGIYDRTTDLLRLASRFAAGQEVLVYNYENKGNPGLLYSDNKTRMTLRLDSGDLLDFDLEGRLTRTEDKNGQRVDYSYDAGKRLTGISQSGVRAITLNYDAQNRVSSASLPGGRTVTYGYDAKSNLITAHADAPTGRISKYSYDANHNLLQIQDEAGNAVATQNYDIYGRVTSTLQPGVATPFTQNYSLASRTAQTTGPGGINTITEYDTRGNPVKVTDSRGHVTRNTFNIHRDLTSTTTADGKRWSYFYDGSGNRVATVVPSGRADRAFYNDFGRPVTTFQGPVDAEFNTAFDSENRMVDTNATSYTDNYTQYGYDAKGNLTSITDANGSVRTFGYDTRGNRSFSRDGRGKQTDMTYDTNSRLTRVRDAMGHQVDITYDSRDNIIQITTQAGTTDYGYNTKNQMTSVTTGNVGARRTTSYTYDAKGNLSTVTDPAGKITIYSYDARGNLTEIKHDGVVRFNYEYNDANRLTATRYTGMAGGARATVTPLSPVGNEKFRDLSTFPITWAAQGDWTGNQNVTIQYSTDGSSWTNIATVSAASGSYNWASPVLSNTLRIRFVRTGDSAFRQSATPPFSLAVSAKYYVNDTSTVGDQYCTAAGRPYSGTVNGRTPATAVTDPQAIIDNYVLRPGDTIYIDTGNYTFNHDIEMTVADTGTRDLPITIQGSTGSGITSITRSSVGSSTGVFFVYGTGNGPTPHIEGITLQNLNVSGGRYGIVVFNGDFCKVINNETHHNGRNASAAGANGEGTGIVIAGGGENAVDSNKCYNNGGSGAAGSTAGMKGGDGEGIGILNQASSNSRILNNECYANGALGSAGGGSTGLAGVSRFTGISVHSSNTDCEIRNNSIRDTVAVGHTSTTGYAGTAVVTGIRLADGEDHRILNNKISGLRGTGGDSNTQKGGQGMVFGVSVWSTSKPAVSGNSIFLNEAYGGRGTTASSANRNGEADSVAIWCTSAPGAVISNNLAHDNSATAANKRGNELPGQPYSGGFFGESSTGLKLLNNTFYRNRIALSGGGVPDDQSGQIYLFSASTGATVMNNICGSFDPDCPALSLETDSQTGFVSDNNDLVSQGGNVGAWGDAYHATIAAWRGAANQDANSKSIDPGFTDVASNNYHLKSTSPLIDAGTTSDDVADDIDGELRPAAGPSAATVANFDIGCDEYLDSDNDSVPNSLEASLYSTNPNDADSDDDGLPDGWEIANSLNPLLGTGINGPSGDPDNDGFNNFAELQAGTDPRSALSAPATSVNTPWHEWQVRSFTAPEVANAAISGELADPDRDGLSNLMECQLGTDPKKGSYKPVSGFIPGLPDVFLEGNAMVIIYHRDLSKTDLASSPQWSGNLQTWNTSGFTEVVQGTHGTVQLVKATIPRGAVRWLRLRCWRVTP